MINESTTFQVSCGQSFIETPQTVNSHVTTTKKQLENFELSRLVLENIDCAAEFYDGVRKPSRRNCVSWNFQFGETTGVLK